MIDCSKDSWKELNRILASNPTDTEYYKKAQAERDHRLKKYGIYAAIGTAIVAAMIKIFWK